jgi:uncharacterized protein
MKEAVVGHGDPVLGEGRAVNRRGDEIVPELVSVEFGVSRRRRATVSRQSSNSVPEFHRAMTLRMGMCPICGKGAKPRTENKAAPFCSPRCKAVDLGKWLNEDYRVPADDAPHEDEPTEDVAPDNVHVRH